jgi:hypothetical protein
MKRSRLLLIEFIREDPYRNFRGEMFPFYQGFAAEHGIPVLWGRIGIAPGSSGPNPFIIDLPRADADALCRALRGSRATHVLLNEKPAPGLARRLRRAGPALRIASMAQRPGQLFPFSSWLGLAGAGDSGSLELAALDYRNRPLNDRAAAARPFIKVLCGSPCLYRKPLARNPHFAGVDLSGAAKDFGCSFCESGSGPEAAGKADQHLASALRQVAAAARSLRGSAALPPFMLTGGIVFLRLGEFFRRIMRMGLPPAQCFFSCRVDEFLSRSAVIRGLLPRLRKRGHSIHLCNMGAENFSPAENARLNKGISNGQILRAHGIIRELEQRYPETFFFTRHGGFGFILFTPWTTLSDLAANLRMARVLGIPSDSFFFRTRLQLMPGRPITLLAERDGLTAPDFAAAMAFDSGCIERWDQSERPWRFRHPETAVFYHILSRWGVRETHALDLSQDPLYRMIHDVRSSLPQERGATQHVFQVLLRILKKTRGNVSVKKALGLAAGELASSTVRRPSPVLSL